MTMDRPVTEKYLMDWDEGDVHLWLSMLGLPHYERQIRENAIRGDSLCALRADSLKGLGVASVGQRLSILKAVYDLKLSQNILINEDDYIPPSTENISIDELHSSVKDQAQRLRTLEEDTRTINNAMRTLLEEITKLRTSMTLPGEDKAPKPAPYLRSDIEAIGLAVLGNSAEPESRQKSPTQSSPAHNPAAAYISPQTATYESSDNTKVSLDDPTWKVLPAALKKHRIDNDEWPNYAMFISFGPQGNRTKRRLESNEKPLYLFKKLKEAKKNPAFVLKNMKDLRSPGTPEPLHPPHLSS